MSNHDLPVSVPYLATEVLLCIFTFLTPPQLYKCRLVCSRWQIIVDSLLKNDYLWLNSCKSEYPYNYNIAYQKRNSRLSWMSLYRSLHLWSKLQYATETQDEFASASQIRDEIWDFKTLRDGIIGVHTRGGIIYFDINTLNRSSLGTISGEYLRYFENPEVIVLLGIWMNLRVIRKLIRPAHQENVALQSVKNFLVIDGILYYVTLNNELYMCNLHHKTLSSVLLVEMSHSIICLGNKNGLHVLTFQRNIYTVKGNEIIFQKMLNETQNLLHTLNEYNFLEYLDWRVYFQWMYTLQHYTPKGPLRDIIIVKVYGDFVLVGSNSGILRIYYSPYFNDESDLFNTDPVKQYNFTERSDCPVLTHAPIIQIDVIEGLDGHTVLACMPKKIALINFNHNFGRLSPAGSVTDVDSIGIEYLYTND